MSKEIDLGEVWGEVVEAKEPKTPEKHYERVSLPAKALSSVKVGEELELTFKVKVVSANINEKKQRLTVEMRKLIPKGKPKTMKEAKLSAFTTIGKIKD